MEAVFFDFVGTLITRAGEDVTHQNIVREVLERAGRSDLDVIDVWKKYEAETSSAFKKLAGGPYVRIKNVDTEAMQKVGKHYGFKVPENFWEISISMHERYGKLFPGTVETLKNLRGLGIHVGMITDSDNEYLERHLRALGIRDLFDSITTSEDAGYYKPHPKPFQLALERAGVSPAESLYIGDNPTKDCVGAKKSGMLSALLDPTGEKRKLWNECDFVVSELPEVVDIIRGLIMKKWKRGR